MIRNALLGAAAVSLAALGATAANAGSYGGYNSYDGYDNYQDASSYYCHYHTKKIRVKVLVGYDYYNNPIYKYRYKYVKYCHKHYYQNSY
jgi:hypothetical protein